MHRMHRDAPVTIDLQHLRILWVRAGCLCACACAGLHLVHSEVEAASLQADIGGGQRDVLRILRIGDGDGAGGDGGGL